MDVVLPLILIIIGPLMRIHLPTNACLVHRTGFPEFIGTKIWAGFLNNGSAAFLFINRDFDVSVLACAFSFEIQKTVFKKSSSVGISPSSEVPFEFSSSADDIIDCMSQCLQFVECHSAFFSLSLKTCKGYSFQNVKNATFIPNLDTISYEEDEGRDCSHSGYIYSRSVSLCFKEYLDVNEWNQSRELCQSDQADLVILNTDEKIEYMRDFITSRYTFGYWQVGMADTDGNGDWRWVNNEPVTTRKTNFDLNHEQRCGALNMNSGLLIDAGCQVTRRRICERKF